MRHLCKSTREYVRVIFHSCFRIELAVMGSSTNVPDYMKHLCVVLTLTDL